jgi:hypothetical protein
MFAPPHVLAGMLPPSLVSSGRRTYVPIVRIRYPPDELVAASDEFELSGSDLSLIRLLAFHLRIHGTARQSENSASLTAVKSRHQHADHRNHGIEDLQSKHPTFGFPVSHTIS